MCISNAGLQGHQKTRDRRKDESTWVNGRSWTFAAEANDPKWSREVKDKGKVSEG